jgi:hypothetical protein
VSPAPRADTRGVESAEHARSPLGELLLSKGLVTEQQLDLALREQEQSGRPLGAILVERGVISGPALAVALAQQNGVDLATQRAFGTGLWAEIERRHRVAGERAGDNIFKLETAQHPPLEAVPDPDPELDRLRAENQRLEEELERLRAESLSLRLVEEPQRPSSHLLFVPTPQRYLVLERQGPPPEPGDGVELTEGRFVVGKVGRAPFPGEARPCAFLLVR